MIRSSVAARSSRAEITLQHVCQLYRRYQDDLRVVRKEQRELRTACPEMKTQLDDLEAEITYLLMREERPATVVEIGSLHGWSTTWILRALRDNRAGALVTHDLIDNARHNVPAELAEGRWTFVPGDARETLRGHRHSIDHLFIDAAHTASFARWFVGELFPTVRAGTTVSVHDVFHRRRPWPVSEGRVVLSWLANNGAGYFTPSRLAAARVNRELKELKQRLGLLKPVHDGLDDPMLFFRMP
ncbi:Predicted O-methyltransferase YrrM [Micromonospora halophytica]|uniref:Predicted O-methyltransferase YrrM n=2 Tax=Micromonospora halophytica TaxID=47864 RepID=A0A1C5HU76_9ACTN|nr:Predicted O-methyltransferase YrrM [Micromonospora halophytica]